MDCTASLRPFSNPAEADAAVANIRARGRLIVGLDIGSNLFSFRDPITGEITGFDVDIAGEVARDIFGTPSQVEYRILSSADRIAALQNNRVDIVVKTMSITCERKKLVNFSTVYFSANQRILAPRDSTISQASDLSGKRVCAVKGTTSLQRIQQITPSPIIVAVVTWADCLVALQQRQVDAVSTDDSILAGLVSQDPYLHIVGSQHERRALRHRDQPEEHRPGPLRQRHPGTHSPRRHLEHVVPQVVNRARPSPRATRREVQRLMPTTERDTDDAGPGTQPASFEDLGMDSLSTMRPMATQAVFRPHFDDDADETSAGTAETEPEDHPTTVTRTLSPTRRLGGGLVEIPRVPAEGSAHRADDQPCGGRVEAVLLELRTPGGQVHTRRPRAVGGLVSALRQCVFVSAATEPGRHDRRAV